MIKTNVIIEGVDVTACYVYHDESGDNITTPYEPAFNELKSIMVGSVDISTIVTEEVWDNVEQKINE